MEPSSISAVSTIVAKVLKEIKELIAQAEKLAKEDSEYYRKWLEAALRAIQGLEKEYEGILEQAVSCNIANAGERKQLLERIRGYIQGENLRPVLKEAITHLEQGVAVFRPYVQRRFLFFKPDQTREEAL